MPKAMAELHRARQVVYAVLAEIFLQVPAPAILHRQLEAGVCREFPVETDRSEVADGMALLCRWEASLMAGSLEEAVPDLRLDYARLFMGPGKVLAPPWESVYCTEERLLFRESTMQVREFYRRHGLEVPRLNQEPDDHFGLELAFMAVLAERTAWALEKVGASAVAVADEVPAPGAGQEVEAGVDLAGVRYLVEEQHNFLQEHLGQWVEPFSRDVEQYAATDYYRGLALVVRGFVLEDGVWLERVR